MQRCYCGTSIHVEVVFAENVTPRDRKGILVCARFEPSRVVALWPSTIVDASANNIYHDNERKLVPGEMVTLPASLLAEGKRNSNHTVWIRADKESEAKCRTLPEVSNCPYRIRTRKLHI